MERNKFDTEIKHKLENLQAGFDPASWELLAHRMDFDAQQEVDDLWKGRANSLEAAIPPSSWETMSQLIEADETAAQIEEEVQLDSVAYEKLRNLDVPFKSHHWALMAKRIEEEFSLRHKLYRYKVAEIALMALLLLTFFRFMPLMGGWPGHGQPAQQQEAKPAGNSDRIIPDFNGQQQQNGVVSDGPMAAVSGENTQLPQAVDIDRLPPADRSYAANGQLNNNRFLASLPMLELAAPTFSPTYDLGKNIAARIKKADGLAKSTANLNGQPDKLAAIGVGLLDPSFGWELPPVKTSPFKKRGNLSFSIFTTADFNYVLTPPDQINVLDTLVKTEANATLASGYGGGVTVGYKKGKWELQTGGIYSFKRYIPNTPIFIFETINYYVKEDFRGIQLDIFQLPLNARYHFKNSGKWRFYASAGASGHFITSSVYEIGYERLALNSFPNPPSSPDDTKSIREEKDFPNGLLDGGTLDDNFYMTANFGFGVERFLAPKWAVFFQPNYQHYLMSRGIGTNKDKIFTTSFYLGTKFNLK